MVNIGDDWDEILKDEFTKEYYLKLRSFLKEEYASGPVYPPHSGKVEKEGFSLR